MHQICADKMCAGCMACVDACPVGAVHVEPGAEYYQPVIDQEKCIDCGRCRKVCQQIHPFEMRKPLFWRQGWTISETERASSSSGGLVSAIARAFIASGGTVCACSFRDGAFGFELATVPEEVSKFKGSKYVKSNPIGAYRKVRSLLMDGGKVLFVGLPCQVSAMRNYIGSNLATSLYTIDLICHGSPSPELLRMFLKEHGIELNKLEEISFRNKATFRVGCDLAPLEESGVLDRYLVAFLSGLSYTENCYSCPYARMERVSDLTLGDSWGSVLAEEAERGISLALCQSEKGAELLQLDSLKLLDVNVDRAIANNGQLNNPSPRPKSRKRFIDALNAGSSFEHAVGTCLPQQCAKQALKRALIKLGIRKRGGGCLYGFVKP